MHPLANITAIDEDEIPPDPSNKFLMRAATNDKKNGDKDKKEDRKRRRSSRSRSRSAERDRGQRDRDRGRDRSRFDRGGFQSRGFASGKKIKGRGRVVIFYRMRFFSLETGKKDGTQFSFYISV